MDSRTLWCRPSQWLAACIVILLAGCGGGTDSSQVQAMRMPIRFASAPMSSTDGRADRLLAYAEAIYPAALPAGSSSGQFGQFRYRFYPSSGIYVGVVTQPGTYPQDGVFVMGGPFGNAPVQVGSVADFIADAPVSGFVSQSTGHFILNGAPFRVGGTNAAQVIANNDRSGLVSALSLSRQMGVNVVRIFGGSEIGSLDGSVQTLGTSPTWRPYFQYWDPVTKQVIYNDGANGLGVLDLAVYVAREKGLRLIIALDDNWDGFYGGANQYVVWQGGTEHGAFFTSRQIRDQYKAWVAHLLNRVNPLTGVRYGDDPTVFAWELLNEASCYSVTLPAGACSHTDIENWISEMSAYVRSLTPQQMIAVGDQGHFAFRPDPAMGWPYSSTNEPDFDTVLKMANIDFGTYHVYPYENVDGNGTLTALQYGVRYLQDHQAAAVAAGKAALLEEVGARDPSVHAQLFDTLLSQLNQSAGPGFLFWGIGARFSSGASVWDAGGYTIYPDTPSGSVLAPWISVFAGASL
jgi:mannan endo-1,4-beta-mannosidase